MPRPKKEKPNHGDLYEVKITVGKALDGSLIRKSFYSSISKADARRQADEWKAAQAVAEQLGEAPAPRAELTFEKWADKWVKTYVLGKVKDNSFSSTYEIPLRVHILPYFGKRKLSGIMPVDVQRFLDLKVSEGHSLDYLKKMRGLLKNLFDDAVENNLKSRNPVTRNVKIDVTKIPPKQEKRFYTRAQTEMVIEFAKTHSRGLPALVMLTTGVSRSELLGLRWSDITPDRVMHVQRDVTIAPDQYTGKQKITINEGLKTQYRKRDIPLPEWLYDRLMQKPRVIYRGGSVLRNIPGERVDLEYIFHNAKGEVQNPRHFSTYVYKRFIDDLVAHFAEQGVDMPDLTPHELRHTWATLNAQAGMNMYTLARLGGWTDFDMVMEVYGHLDVEEARKQMIG